MGDDENAGEVSLALPATPESVSIVRAVVASVASRLALPYDAVDDLRIAVAEAASFLLTSDSASSRLRVDLHPGDSDLRLRVWTEGPTSAERIDRAGALSWRVMEGLADEVVESSIDGRPAIELRMRTLVS